MTPTEIIVGAWQGALALVGLICAVRARDFSLRASLSAWNASGSQFCLFLGVAAFCLVAVGLFCSSVARALFPDAFSGESNWLYLIPVTQTLALATLLLAVKIFPYAFPKNFDAEKAEARESWRALLSPRNRYGVPALFAIGFGSSLLATLLVAAAIPFLPENLQGLFRENQMLVNAFEQSDNIFVTGLCVPAIAIFTPIIEEIIFRAGLYRFFKSNMPAVPAAILSSVIFALMHDAPISYLPLTVLGCVFCWAYEKTGRIAAPICIHALFNANTLLCLAVL